MNGGSTPLLVEVDGRFFTNLEGEEVPELEADAEIAALRVGSRLDVFCKTSAVGDTTRLEPPLCGLWVGITAAGVVRL